MPPTPCGFHGKRFWNIASCPFTENLHKFSDGAVVGSLDLRREEAARQLAKAFVVADAVAALALSLAGLIGTVASLFIGIDTALQYLFTL